MGRTKWKTFCFCRAVTPPSIARICETHFLHCMWHRFQSFDLCLPCRLCGNTLFTGWTHELNSLRGQTTEDRVLAKQILLALKLLCEWNLSQSDNVKYEKDTKTLPEQPRTRLRIGAGICCKKPKKVCYEIIYYDNYELWVCLNIFDSWIYNNIHKCGNFVEPVAEAKQQLQRLQLFSTLSCIFASDSTAAQQPSAAHAENHQQCTVHCSEMFRAAVHWFQTWFYCHLLSIFPMVPMMAVFFLWKGKLATKWSLYDHSMWRIRSTVDWPVSHQDRFGARTAQGPRHACLTRKCIVREQKIKLCRWRVFLFVYMLETRTWIDVSCLWTWLCFQTCCTPKTKVEVKLQRFWLIKVVRLVQCNFKHAHLISIAMPEIITICAMHTDCKPRPSCSPSFKLHGLAMESRISGSSHFYVRSSISIFFNPHLNLACSVALAVWNNCVLINIQCKSKCNSPRPLDMICHVWLNDWVVFGYSPLNRIQQV